MDTPFIDVVELYARIQQDSREHILMTRSGEEFIYQPHLKKYELIAPLLLDPARNRSVSNAEALLLVVFEEARRNENNDGDQMTVIFNETGGQFSPDDMNRSNPDTWTFKRKPSTQLQYLTSVLNTAFDHAGLLRAMSTIRYSVEGFAEIYSAMRRVRVDKKASITSQPRLEDGKNGMDLSFSFQIEGENGGSTKAKFPSEFNMVMPLISMSKKSYQVMVEIESWVDDKQLKFALRAPGIDSMLTQAILEEIEAFTAEARKKLPNLLIVTDL